MNVRKYERVPVRKKLEDGHGTVVTPQFKKLMKQVDQCVAAGGHFEGFSDNTETGERITMTLYWPEHPHDILKRGPGV